MTKCNLKALNGYYRAKSLTNFFLRNVQLVYLVQYLVRAMVSTNDPTVKTRIKPKNKCNFTFHIHQKCKTHTKAQTKHTVHFCLLFTKYSNYFLKLI